jgi:hypothetical protein
MRAIHGSYAGLAAGPDLEHNEDSWMWVDSSGAWIATDYSDNEYTWHFNNDGGLTFPQGTFLGTSDGPGAFIIDGAVDKDILIYTYNGETAHGWTFGANGTLTLPGTGTIANPSSDGGPVGTIHTFTADYTSNTSSLTNSHTLLLENNISSQEIQSGWIITFANSTTKTVTSSSSGAGNWYVEWSGDISLTGTDVWPLTVQSADYSAGTTTKTLELTPDGATTWTFGDDGNLTAPGTISAKDQIKIEAADVATLYEAYQETLEMLANEFMQDEYTGQGYPASKDSITGLARAKALNPLIPDAWITIASTLRTAYFVWTASSITLTVDGGGFVIANGGNVSWRFDEATGLRFPDSTYQTTAFVGSALRLKSTNGSQTVTLGNDGLVTFPGETGFQATFGSVEPVGDVLHSVNNLHLESEQSVTVNSGNDVFDLYNDYQVKELTWETIRDENAQIGPPRAWDDLPGYQAWPLLQDYTPTGLEPPITNSMLVAAEEAFIAYYLWQEALNASGVNISVAGSNVWHFGADGRTTFPNGTVPEHSYGAPDDKEGMVVFSDPYIYYCKQDYVNNTTDIWVRVAWTGTNW